MDYKAFKTWQTKDVALDWVQRRIAHIQTGIDNLIEWCGEDAVPQESLTELSNLSKLEIALEDWHEANPYNPEWDNIA